MLKVLLVQADTMYDLLDLLALKIYQRVVRMTKLGELLRHVVFHKCFADTRAQKLLVVADLPQRVLLDVHLLRLEVEHLLAEVCL